MASGVFDTFASGTFDRFLKRLTPDPFTFPPTLGAATSTTIRPLPAKINGMSNNTTVRVNGASSPAYCISSTALLSFDILAFTIASSSVLDNGHFNSLRSISSSLPDQVVTATVTVGSSSATWELSTGTAASPNCSMDIDGDGLVRATTDGLMLARAMLGMTGTAVTNGAIGANVTRTTWSAIRNFLNTRCGKNFAL